MASLGELVKRWREDSGLNLPEFARLIGSGVKYQNLQQLENGGAKQPRYIAHLARAMRATVDDLLALRMPPPLGASSMPAGAPVDAAASALPHESGNVSDDPSDEADYTAMLTAFTRQVASLPRSARVGIAAMLVELDDPSDAAEVMLQVRRLTAAPAAAGADPIPSDQTQSSRLVKTPAERDGRRQSSRYVGQERNRPGSQPQKQSSKK